jgi:hypothetical protein
VQVELAEPVAVVMEVQHCKAGQEVMAQRTIRVTSQEWILQGARPRKQEVVELVELSEELMVPLLEQILISVLVEQEPVVAERVLPMVQLEVQVVLVED